MAKKRKKSRGSKTYDEQAAPSTSSYSQERSADTGIREAENGYVIRVSCEGMNKNKKGHSYESKTYVATDHPTAVRIATQGFAGLAKKVRGKKSGKTKMATSKR